MAERAKLLPNACPKPISAPKAPKLKVRQKNVARSASEFKRTLHSRARQKFVNLLDCSACGVWGYSQNAHVLGIEGATLKGHYTTVAPLCGIRPDDSGNVYEGCHRLFDTAQEKFRARFPSYNPRQAAKETEAKWKAFCASSEGATP